MKASTRSKGLQMATSTVFRWLTGWLLTILIFAFGPFDSLHAQHVPSKQRGDANFRQKSNIDGNNVRTTVWNFGFTGSLGGPDEFQYEFPKNSRRTYINLAAIWLAGEVVDERGNTIQIVDFPTFRQSPTGRSWNLEPVPGYQNPNVRSIARSDDPRTWPPASQGGWRDKRDDDVDPGWIGSWNGFFGKNVFNADQELFYKASDDLYTRFNYIPDETDPTRGGLGLIMDVRGMAWSQVLIADVIFFIHDILNDGTKRIPKSSFLIWLADLVGGDSQDDFPFVDLQTSIAFLTDADRRGTEVFGTDPVGLGSVKYIETPGNAVDGIDNDGDADFHPELIAEIAGDPAVRVPIFTAADFQPRFIRPGDKMVLIDSTTFERRIIAYPEGGGSVVSLGRRYVLPPEGLQVVEDTTANSLDDNFNGLIDERLTLHLERFDEVTGTVRPVRFINYLSFAIGDTIKRGFIVPGKAAEWNYQNVAPMIDESPDDGFDNDRDWIALQDDVGLDGVPDTGDRGEGDGRPTSGAGTDFPGEPNIDKTDVSEVDVIGLTSAQQDPAFNINFNTVADDFIWRKFMVPGKFFLPRRVGEFDTYVSSAFFPIDPGQRQRMAISVAMADGGLTLNDDLRAAVRKQEQARVAYTSDYQFAQAPLQPTLTVVPGDKKVTLYWDDVAEASVDRFIERLGGDGRDFEGYRIYRATDPAFLDAKVITGADGIPLLNRPIAQFDKKNGISGFHPVDIRGVKFDLGTDTGLQHTYVDTPLVNGQRYFYAVTAYDFGYAIGNIAPTETSIKVDVDPQGNVTTGTNVAVVRPRAPVAGYLPAEVTAISHARGGSTGQVGFRIVDPRAVKDGHQYEITFEDTLIRRTTGNILTTKNFSLRDLTAGQVLINKSKNFNAGNENPVIDGFQLSFVNEERVQLNQVRSGWNKTEVYPYQFSPTQFLTVSGEQRPNDYMLVIGEVGTAVSKDTTILFFRLPSKQVNFKVLNMATGDPVTFAFAEVHGGDGRFSIDPRSANNADTIFLLEPNASGRLVYTWQILLNLAANRRNPEPGDTLRIFLRKPFLSSDAYTFTIRGEGESSELAQDQLNNIRVVPNPYVAAASWEPQNLFSSGRGPRELHFINLPRQCTIRIFNVSGTLVAKIDHESTLDNGTAIWNLLSKDNLSISYGVYVFHVNAPGIGEKTGTFAVIK